MTLQVDQPIVYPNRTMFEHFRTEMIALGKTKMLTGSGTPEASIAADVGQLYMDTSGTAGLILYVKRDSDVAGDATKGWILV